MEWDKTPRGRSFHSKPFVSILVFKLPSNRPEQKITQLTDRAARPKTGVPSRRQRVPLTQKTTLQMPEWSRTPMDSPKSLGGSPERKTGRVMIGSTARLWKGCRNDSVNVLVDSGASGHYFDDAIIPGFRDRLEEYKVLDVPRKISTAGGGGLNGTAHGVLRGHVINDKGVRRSVQLSCLIVPGLGRNLFSVKQAAANANLWHGRLGHLNRKSLSF